MPSRVQIRKASDKDFPEIMKLAELCLPDFVGSSGVYPSDYVTNQISSRIADYLDDASLMAYEEDDNGRLIAFCLTECTGRDAYIWFLGVHPSARRRGVGEAILAEMFRLLREKGITFVELTTSEENTVARAFWTNQGFQDAKMKVFGKHL